MLSLIIQNVTPEFKKRVLAASHYAAISAAQEVAISLMDDVAGQVPDPIRDGPAPTLICREQKKIVRGWFSDLRRQIYNPTLVD